MKAPNGGHDYMVAIWVNNGETVERYTVTGSVLERVDELRELLLDRQAPLGGGSQPHQLPGADV